MLREKRATPEELTDGMERYRATKPPDRQWCNPATWLNQGRWTDQPTEIVPHNGHQHARDGPEAMPHAEERAEAAEPPQEPRGLNHGLDFGRAIIALKQGLRVACEGWNGKGMWLALIYPGNAVFKKFGAELDMHPCIGMKTAATRGEMQPGWLAPQADMLAEDWCVISENG